MDAKNNKHINSYEDELMDDIFVMMEYARKSGIPLPEELQEDIALLFDNKKTLSKAQPAGSTNIPSEKTV